MKITICIGSSCHLKGSRQIVEKLQQLVAENNLQDQVEEARAALYREQARKLRLENDATEGK